MVGAIVIGNAAYQGGNISGATLGLTGLTGNAFQILGALSGWPIIIGLIAFILLWLGSYKTVEKNSDRAGADYEPCLSNYFCDDQTTTLPFLFWAFPPINS